MLQELSEEQNGNGQAISLASELRYKFSGSFFSVSGFY